MTTILVPVDGSALAQEAIPYARSLLRPDDRLLLLRVVPLAESIAAAMTGSVIASEDEVSAMWKQAADGELAEAAGQAGIAADRIETEVAVGDPAEQIVATAQAKPAEMIVMASHGRGAIGRAIFGSVADRVAHTATVPVMLVRPSKDHTDRPDFHVARVVVPLDGSALAEEALPVAKRISAQLAVPIHLVRAIDPVSALPMASSVTPVAPVSPEIATQIMNEIEAEAKGTLAAAERRLAGEGFTATAELLEGSPFFAIADALKPGDVLVMTSHGRTGVRRWLMGSVAEKLVREAPAPVVIVPAVDREAAAKG